MGQIWDKYGTNIGQIWDKYGTNMGQNILYLGIFGLEF